MENKNYLSDDSYTWDSDSGDEIDWEYILRDDRKRKKEDEKKAPESDSYDEVLNQVLQQEMKRRIVKRKNQKKGNVV